jgi:hypothetical protein
MGYPNFQHHPDGWIIIKQAEDQFYFDTIGHFEADYGQAYPELPTGYIGRYYEPGVSHYITTGDTAASQPLQWLEGDRYIAAYDMLLASKKAREATGTI